MRASVSVVPLLVLATLVPLAAAVDEERLGVEDYEDEDLGETSPNEEWYTTTRANDGGSVVAGGADGTAQAFSFSSGGGAWQGVTLTPFDMCNTPESVALKILKNAGSASDRHGGIIFSSGDDTASSSDDADNIWIGVAFQGASSLVFWLKPVGETRSYVTTTGNYHAIASGTGVWHAVTLDITCSGDEITVTACASSCNTKTEAAPESAWSLDTVTLQGIIGFSQTSGHSGKIDQLELGHGGVVQEPEIQNPAEFDEGLKGILNSMGIVSPESQVFFTIFLVGLALVGTAAALLWTGPGRLKNGILVGVQALAAVLMIFFGFIELWGLVLMIMLGAFSAFGGSRVARNTFYEIRDALGQVDLRSALGRNRGGKTITDTTQEAAAVASESGGDES